MIKVLHIVGKMDMAGLETMIMNYYRHIDRTQVQFHFIPLSGKHGYYDDEISSLGGKVLYPPSSYNWKKPYTFKKWFEDLVSTEDYSILHSHNGGAARIVFPIAKKYGLINILHSHNTGVRQEPYIKQVVRRMALNSTFKYIDCYFACSKEAGEYLFGSTPFHVVSNAIELGCFKFNERVRTNLRESLHISSRTFVIGTVGRLTHQKNPEFIIELFNELSKIHPNIKLLWIGDGELKDTIADTIEKKGLSSKVMMLGSIPNVCDYYQIMDAFILPSLFEGLGIVAIEAQASGLKTLCSNRVPQLAGVTDLCSFYDVKKLDQWSYELETIIDNPYKRTCYDEAIRAKGFDIAVESDKLLEIYKELV